MVFFFKSFVTHLYNDEEINFIDNTITKIKNMGKYISLIIGIVCLLSSIFIIDSLSDYKKDRNVEVVVLNKTQLQVPGGKNRQGRVDSYLIVQALSEIKDEAVNLNEHTFIRNSKTMTENGSIKDKLITKTWKNGPKFDVSVDLTTYMTSPVGTRLIFKVKYKDIQKDQSKENLITISLLLLTLGIIFLIISLLKILLWR